TWPYTHQVLLEHWIQQHSTVTLLIFTASARPEPYTLSLHDALPIFTASTLSGSRSAARARPRGKMIGPSHSETVGIAVWWVTARSEEHTSELQSQSNLVCRLLLEKKNKPTLHHGRL